MYIFLIYVLSFISGIIAQFYSADLSAIIFLSILSATMFMPKNHKIAVFILSIFFAIGATRYYFVNKQNLAALKLFNPEQSVNCIGYVYDVSDVDLSSYNTYSTCITLKIKYPANLSSYVKIYCYNKCYLPIGSTVKFYNLKIKPAFESQLYKENIYGVAFVSQLKYKILGKIKYWDFLAHFRIYRNSLYKRIKYKLSGQTYVLFSQIFLGKTEYSPLSEDIRNKFQYWGIVHYLARSGLHVTFLLTIFKYLFRYIPINFFLKKFLLCLILLFYTLLSWSSNSFNRAYNTFLLSKTFVFSGIPNYLDHTFMLVLLLTLLYDPVLVFLLDFQLSYALTMALIVFNKLYI